MQADIFYQTSAEYAWPLTLVTQTECQGFIQTLSAYEQNVLTSQQFNGKYGELTIICNPEGQMEKVFIGAGEGDFTLALGFSLSRLPQGCYEIKQSISKQSIITWSLAQYLFDKYKTLEIPPKVLLVRSEDLQPILNEANAIFLIRDLINTPANHLNPETLGDALIALAQQFDAEYKDWVGEELLENNYPAIFAVGAAASVAPRLLSLTWGDSNHPKVTLVGKGVCFDSGGLDLKPASGMRLMKKDMAGAAHVIGLGQWIMSEQLPIHLQILIPAVENAVSSHAYRPGDVLTMRNGLTVEIDNTDAEGRLILADALVKACEEQPELVIDFATLTGSARTAVGTDIAALFSNNDELAQEIVLAGNEVSDHIWRMPLFSGYEMMLLSTVADMVNSPSSPYAGAITAGLFLQRFVKPTIPWLHFDIMAWNLSHKPGKPEGGEAMGVRAVAKYLMQHYGDSK